MPRHRRLELPGAIYHIIARGIERRALFTDAADRREFLKRLETCLTDTHAHCLAWALMPNHVHLLIRTGDKPLSDLMRRLLTGYAIYFNRRHKRSGYLYQNRYKSILCQEDAYLLELVRYIHLNPVRAGLVKDMPSLERYPWTGHCVLAGKSAASFQNTDEVLARFGAQRKHAVERYREFVREGWNMGRREDLRGGGLRRSAGGWQGVRALRRSDERWQGDERILGNGDFVTQALKSWEETLHRRERLLQAGWDVHKLIGRVGELLGVQPEAVGQRSKGTVLAHARTLVAYWGYRELGIPSKELCEHLDMSRPALTKSVRRGEEYARLNNLKLIS